MVCEGVRSVPCVRGGSLGTSDSSTASCEWGVCGVCVGVGGDFLSSQAK